MGRWGKTLLWLKISMIFGAASFVLYASEDYLPKAYHYEAFDRGRDCSIFRHLHQQTLNEITSYQNSLKEVEVRLQKTREILEACANDQGIERLGTPQSEALAAELCPEYFDAWLKSSYQLYALREDLNAAKESVSLVALRIQRKCGVLPSLGSKNP